MTVCCICCLMMLSMNNCNIMALYEIDNMNTIKSIHICSLQHNIDRNFLKQKSY